ncbi:MAG: LPS export ABC transporter periplasmic protein LptC [Proteobacteria bacterium]|nr:LPS export ABC transporter periplasmic protein LptC [Pseudomonadota bacterium]
MQFHSIKRRSLWINKLKVFLPITSICLTVSLFLWPSFKMIKKDSQTNWEESHPLNNSVRFPHYSAMDNKGQPYELTADKAVEISQDLVQFEQPQLIFYLSDGHSIKLKSSQAFLDKNQNGLELTDSVELIHSKGYKFTTSKVYIDLLEGKATGDFPVSGTGPYGFIKAQAFEIVSNGHKLIFKGGQSLTLKKT